MTLPEVPFTSVSDALASRAAGAPSHVAVRYRDQSVTYGQLDRHVNRLAHRLLGAGVTAGQSVMVLLEPELDVPSVVFAVLRIGAIYVPLDPQYPTARIETMLADVRPALVVSRRSLIDRLGVRVNVPVLALDVDAASIDAAATTPLPGTVAPSAAATIFHTSGTTGRPKGAIATHANLAFFAQAAHARYGHRPDDVIPVIARFSFSISVFELVVPLTAGATIVVLDREHVMDPARMIETLQGVTFFHAGPSLLRTLIAAMHSAGLPPSAFARVRHASSGGDMVPPQLLAELRAQFESAEIFVIYGCSEISCMGCTAEVRRTGAITRTYVGAPFPQTAVRVLGDQHRPVAPGEPGEVYFAGPGVVAGYLDRPELDAERFIDYEGRRYYRTGDVGRWHEVHGLELLGRVDFQVKIRGMRVECAEVEFHLRQIRGIRDGVVVAREQRGEKILAAFVVRDPSAPDAAAWDASSLAATVRRHLSAQLPDYMIHMAIVELPALPLNHNGKVDRLAMPELPSDEQVGAAARVRPPRTPTEQRLAAIWSELLKRPHIGRTQNFFELGGDSLLALQVILRAESDLGVTIDGMALLRESLAEIAAACDARLGQVLSTDERVDRSDDDGADGDRIDSFFFGAQASLYGVLYHGAAMRAKRAVLLCAPIGAEEIRTTFVLTRLARRLASQGVPTLRFDFFGTRDSLGEDHDAHPDRWHADILAARRALIERTGATQVVAIGVRLGATLLLHTTTAADGADPLWENIVVWDPVTDGAEYVRELERMHARALHSLVALRGWRRPRPDPARRELIGFTYAREALDAIGRLTLWEPRDRQRSIERLAWLASGELVPQRRAFDAHAATARTSTFVDHASRIAWSDVRRLGDLLPDAGLIDALLALADARA